MAEDRPAAAGFEQRLAHALAELDQSHPRNPLPDLGGRLVRRRWTAPTVVAAAAGASLLVGAGAVAAVALGATATFQPATEVVVAGQPFTVKGSGCVAGADVTVSLDGSAVLLSTTADGNGNFVAQPMLPTGTALGSHTLTARCDNGSADGLRQQLAVELRGAPELMPVTLVVAAAPTPGGEAQVKGAGCRPGTTVVLHVDSAQVASVTAGSLGEFAVDVQLRASAGVGRHELTADCAKPDGTPLHNAVAFTVVQPGR